jgi:RNA polymerase sigma-70 factor (ECF subfamily)
MMEEGVESDLIRAAQSGDVLAMSTLLDRLAPYVGRICGPIALNAGPDAAQEALLQVFRDLRTLRKPEALRPWVRRIALREAVRHAQRERRAGADRDALAELPVADDPALAADVRTVLVQLSPDQRAILVLRDLEGLSEEEASAQLGVARGTAKSRLHRARAAFQERWTS